VFEAVKEGHFWVDWGRQAELVLFWFHNFKFGQCYL
jgi:hypothetical protein